MRPVYVSYLVCDCQLGNKRADAGVYGRAEMLLGYHDQVVAYSAGLRLCQLASEVHQRLHIFRGLAYKSIQWSISETILLSEFKCQAT